MEVRSFARYVRRMRDAQRARDDRHTAVAAARCEGYEVCVDEALDEILGPAESAPSMTQGELPIGGPDDAAATQDGPDVGTPAAIPGPSFLSKRPKPAQGS